MTRERNKMNLLTKLKFASSTFSLLPSLLLLCSCTDYLALPLTTLDKLTNKQISLSLALL